MLIVDSQGVPAKHLATDRYLSSAVVRAQVGGAETLRLMRRMVAGVRFDLTTFRLGAEGGKISSMSYVAGNQHWSNLGLSVSPGRVACFVLFDLEAQERMNGF